MSRYSNLIRCAVTMCVLSIAPLVASAQNYTQTNLVSHTAQPANADGSVVTVDPNLVNPWGLARGAATPWWPNDNGAGVATLYSGGGDPVPLVVTIPNAAGVKSPSKPTGIIFNGTSDFVLGADNAPALFLFATEEGTIAGWNLELSPITSAVTEIDESKQGAVFLGLTWVEVGGKHFLLAANAAGREVEVFDSNFKPVNFSSAQFRDPTLPSNFAPYNVQAVGDNVVVTFTKTSAGGDVNGIVDVFTRTGHWLQRLEDGPWFNAPWGVAQAPQDFGFFSHDLLIGNRGSGTIAAFDPVTGQFLGNLQSSASPSADLVISGLWAIEFDNRGTNEFGASTTAASTISTGPALFFAAGIDAYAGGLFGALTPVAAQFNAEDHE